MKDTVVDRGEVRAIIAHLHYLYNCPQREVDDICQDVYLLIEKYPPSDKYSRKTWLYRLCKWAMLFWLQKDRVRRGMTVSPTSRQYDHRYRLHELMTANRIHNSTGDAIRRVLTEVGYRTPQERDMIHSWLDGYTLADTGRQYGMAVQSVTYHRDRIRETLSIAGYETAADCTSAVGVMI